MNKKNAVEQIYVWMISTNEQKENTNEQKVCLNDFQNEHKNVDEQKLFFEQFLKWTKNDCEQKQIMNGFKRRSEKMPVNRNYFWTIFKVNEKWLWTEKNYERLKKDEQKNVGEQKLFSNNFYSERKKTVNKNKLRTV